MPRHSAVSPPVLGPARSGKHLLKIPCYWFPGDYRRNRSDPLFSDSVTHCLPERLHPVSRIFLDYYLRGEMTTAEFLRWFHMPNSDYLDVARCVVRVVAGQ